MPISKMAKKYSLLLNSIVSWEVLWSMLLLCNCSISI